MEAAEYTHTKKIVYLIQHRKLYHISWYIFSGGEGGDIICINLISRFLFFGYVFEIVHWGQCREQQKKIKMCKQWSHFDLD